jgi:hypothetical protein
LITKVGPVSDLPVAGLGQRGDSLVEAVGYTHDDALGPFLLSLHGQ